MLENLGYRVHIVSEGYLAVESDSRGDQAVVLMDVRMPEMDDYEAVAAIRTLEDARKDAARPS
jgi:CheY-like chemotaxis protein